MWPAPSADSWSFRDPVADGRLPCENVVEDPGDIESVRAFRSGHEPEREGCVEPREHAAVARSVCMVDFINDRVVERRRSKPMQTVRSDQLLNRCDHEVAREIVLIAEEP